MTVPLFDVQTGFGGLKKGQADPLLLADLLDELARLDIARALVRTAPDELVRDVPDTNAVLFAAHEAHPALVPCPILVPATGHDFPPEPDQVAEAIARGAGAAWLRPGPDFWSLEDWCSGLLFRALEARRLPAFCLERDLTLDQLARLAKQYPGLPIIFAGVGYRSQRTLLPALETFDNVFLSTGNNYAVHGGLEQLVRHAGPGRLLFGTGFPAAEPMMAVTQLMYADLSDDDKAAIGSVNFARLMEGIVR